MGFGLGGAGGVENCMLARAVSAFWKGGWATCWGWSEVAVFGAARVFASMLGSCVGAGADGAGWSLVRAGLVWVAEAVAVTAVGSRVCRVDGGNFANA